MSQIVNNTVSLYLREEITKVTGKEDERKNFVGLN